MIKTVENFLKAHNLKNKNVVIAYSAGPDSCALALIIDKLKKKFNLKITLAYFNHGWRELEAKAEEVFTKEFANNLGCDYIIGRAPKNLKKSEETARIARYDFLEKTAKKLKTDIVLLAHNKDDNIETLIYRIIKGTSTSGLTSIPAVRDIYYRPLLSVKKSEILEFLKKNKQKFMIDSSNTDEKYKRNLIRNKILPYFKEINPNYSDAIENLIINAVSTRKIVDNFISKIEKKIIKNGKINHLGFIKLDEEVRLEILNNFLYDKLKYRTRLNLIKIDNFITENRSSKTSLNKDEFLVIKNNEIFIQKIAKKNNSVVIAQKEGVFEFEDKKILIKKVLKPDKFPQDKESTCYLNFDFPVTIRHRQAGDRFSPYGLKGSMKLKDYLINEKIEQEKKDDLILLCKDKEICWIAGKKISENYKAKNKYCYEIKLI